MKRIYLTYLGNSMELPQGETVVGRGLSCRLRFNDASVSREHFKVTVNGTRVTVEDLDSRNGTQVNGRTIQEPTPITNGDHVRIGNRDMELLVMDAEDNFDIATVTEVPPEPPKFIERQQRCPECKSPVSVEDDLCRHCGFSWADFRPGAVTKKLAVPIAKPGRTERRRHVRHRIEVPVLYSSENLSVETMALNFSRSGVFVRTQILDEKGTECELTVLVDGAPAFLLRGRVARVVEREEHGEPLGLGIEFIGLGPVERRWLESTLSRLGSPG